MTVLLLLLCLQGDPEKRLGHRGAGEVKLHPWFQVCYNMFNYTDTLVLLLMLFPLERL
jgi:hypothetical protein